MTSAERLGLFRQEEQRQEDQQNEREDCRDQYRPG